jgi:1L-myo-inositol 1-phosphate cytidylyltransferase / CDP-L-myo-inositol myo-inositolphosphotransferase
VVDETTRRQAEDAIFSDLLRGDLGVIARHLNKRISFRITRYLLCKLPITPNQVTLLAAAIGFLGCLVIATGTYSGTVAGFLLVQVQSVLDGCDGELARIRFQQSALGEWLDTVADDALNLALVASMGVGLWRSGHGWPATLASAAACLMLLVYNVVAYRELVRQGVGGEVLKIRWTLARGVDLKSLMSEGHTQRGIAAQVARLMVTLGRKDVFIFSWLLLAAMNLLPVALFWAVLIALSCFVTALAQLLMPHRGH